jgi:hypothetical protein
MRSPRSVLALGLLIGLIVGISLTRLLASDELTHYRGGMLLADGALARALNEQLAGQGAANATIRVTATYRARGGKYCRTFSVTGSAPLAGLACRDGGDWQIQKLLSAVNAATSLELSTSVSGPPLTSPAETQLRAHDWQ